MKDPHKNPLENITSDFRSDFCTGRFRLDMVCLDMVWLDMVRLDTVHLDMVHWDDPVQKSGRIWSDGIWSVWMCLIWSIGMIRLKIRSDLVHWNMVSGRTWSVVTWSGWTRLNQSWHIHKVINKNINSFPHTAYNFSLMYMQFQEYNPNNLMQSTKLSSKCTHIHAPSVSKMQISVKPKIYLKTNTL